MQALPKYQELIDPMIKLLSDNGKPMTNQEIESGIIELLKVPRELVLKVHSGKRTELQYRLAWARTKAKTLGYISSPTREIWEATTLGISLFKKH